MRYQYTSTGHLARLNDHLAVHGLNVPKILARYTWEADPPLAT